MLQHAHVAEDVGMIGPALEQDGVDHLRVVELVELVALDRQRERLFRRQAQLAFRRVAGGGVAAGGSAMAGIILRVAAPRQTGARASACLLGRNRAM
jgi:hypothetical protein